MRLLNTIRKNAGLKENGFSVKYRKLEKDGIEIEMFAVLKNRTIVFSSRIEGDIYHVVKDLPESGWREFIESKKETTMSTNELKGFDLLIKMNEVLSCLGFIISQEFQKQTHADQTFEINVVFGNGKGIFTHRQDNATRNTYTAVQWEGSDVMISNGPIMEKLLWSKEWENALTGHFFNSENFGVLSA